MNDSHSELAWLRTLFDGMEDTLFVHDLEGRILECNAAACSRMGYARAELLTMRTKDLDAPEFAEGFGGRLDAQLRNKRHRCEGVHLTKSGTPVHVDIHTTLIEYRGRPAILAVMRDITERKRTELEREALQIRIAQAEKMESLGVMAGGIAHDFNNLLMGVLGNASIAMLDAPDGSPLRRCLEEIEAAAQRAATLSQQMLAYSGRATYTFKRIDLRELVQTAAPALSAAVAKCHRIEYRLDDNVVVSADASQLRQVLLGLVANASDAYGDAGGAIAVSVRSEHVNHDPIAVPHALGTLTDGAYAVLEVSDAGCGMDDRVIERIFDPFFSTKFTGRGLGLAAVAGIVRGHRGAISVDSAVGKGSTFRAYIPITVAAGESAPCTEPAALYDSARTILIVDDEDIVLNVGTSGLERAGYTVITASGGAEAVDLFRARCAEIGLVILDLTMPRMSGEETYRALKSIRGDIRVVISSGYSRAESAGRFEGEPIEEFLQKPYRARDLVALVSRVLGPPTGTMA